VAKLNGSDGFNLNNWNTAEYCLADNNTVAGFDLEDDYNRLENCSSHDASPPFQVIGMHNFLQGCDGWTSGGTNFATEGGNSYGDILSEPGQYFSSDNPWANFDLN